MYSFWEWEWVNNLQLLWIFNIPHPDRINPRKCVELLFSSLFVTRAGPQRCLRSYNKGVMISTPIMLVKCVYQTPTIPLPISSILCHITFLHPQTDRLSESPKPNACGLPKYRRYWCIKLICITSRHSICTPPPPPPGGQPLAHGLLEYPIRALCYW